MRLINILIQQQKYLQYTQNLNKETHLKKMPKTYMINIDYNYPFTLSSNKQITSQSSIKIIRNIAAHNDNKNILQKILFAHNLRNKYLIKIQYLGETAGGFELCYEFVRAMCGGKEEIFWRNVGNQLEGLTQYLSNIGVKVYLRPKRMALNTEGLLKYYLGLQFELNQEQQDDFLERHYQRQLTNLYKLFQRPTREDQNRMVVPYNNSKSPKQSQIMQKYRKASYATLPSKIPSLFSLNTQINKMKSVVQGINQYHFYGAQQSTVTESRSKALQPVVTNNYMKKQLRKYSGDSKNLVSSNRKLSTKVQDFKSVRNAKQSKQLSHRSVIKYQGSQLKSKMQQMKYQQYIQITKSNKNYLNDFLSVLEDDFNFKPDQITNYANMNQTTFETQPNQVVQNNSLVQQNSTELLKQRAKESIQNSLRLIKKVKGLY